MSHAHGKTKRLGDGSLIAEDFEEGLGHILELSILRNVLLALLILTVITVAVSRVDLGNVNLIVAIIIASIKATIVATFFMHLKFEGKTILMYVFYPLIILSLLIGGTLGDAASKEKVHPEISDPVKLNLVIPNIGHNEHAQEHSEH